MSGRGPLIFLVAGEPSGDVLGGRLMAALAEATGGAARFAGVGGEAMAGEGLRSLFPMAELSVMGLVEILPRARALLRRIAEVADAVRADSPDVVVTIDSPGFAFRLARRLKGSGVALVHYVAPSVWAWRPGRAAKVARLYDHLLTLLPFEPPYFEPHGLACTFVGHPAVAEAEPGDGAGFRARHDIPADAPLLAVLPGSRLGEVGRLLPVFGAALASLAGRVPGLRAAVATVPAVAETVAAAAAGWPLPVAITGADGRADVFAAANAAIAASGTVTVELAAAATPMVICYRMAPATMWIARRLVRVPHIGLANLVLGRGAVPELIQEACTPAAVAAEAERLLVDPVARDAQIEALAEAVAALGAGHGDGETPSRRAARAVLDVIGRKTKKPTQGSANG